MDAPDTSRPAIEAFCKVVCGFVRFWPDHAAITAELTAHLEDHRDALLDLHPDLTPEEAEEAAVQAMGDPEALGRALNDSHSPRFGWFQILFRVSVRTSLVLLLLFCFMPMGFDALATLRNPPLYNDGTNAIIEAYDQTEILADYHPEDAVCYPMMPLINVDSLLVICNDPEIAQVELVYYIYGGGEDGGFHVLRQSEPLVENCWLFPCHGSVATGTIDDDGFLLRGYDANGTLIHETAVPEVWTDFWDLTIPEAR